MTSWQEEKQRRLRALKETLLRTSRSCEKERELWAVHVFLKCLQLDYERSELQAEQQESSIVDVWFRDATFQVKEFPDADRKRGKEIQETIVALEAVHSERDLREFIISTGCEPQFPNISGFIEGVIPFIENQTNKYSPDARRDTDLLIYINQLAIWGVEGNVVKPIECYGWRSISVTKGPWSVVIAASENTPAFIAEALGTLHHFDGDLPVPEDFL